MDGLPVDGRANNGAGLAGDRLICLWLCEDREPYIKTILLLDYIRIQYELV